jgi:GntR family transcriptional regulator
MKGRSVLYLEIANSLTKDIQAGVYPVGSYLPTETELEKKFNVSKITIRKAIELLTINGYVEKQSGKRTTVLSNRLFNKLSKGASFSSILERKGVTLEKKVVGIEKISVTGTEYAEYFGKEATKITRLYYYEKQPYTLFEHFLHGDVVTNISQKMLQEQSLYRILADNGYMVDHFQDFFEVAKLPADVKQTLHCEIDYGMKRVRKSFSQDQRIIEISHAFYNTAISPYIIEFEI